jgi:hypothetical protein
MRNNKITDKQKSLVDTLVARGCTIKEAAKVAGYSCGGNGDGGRVNASKALRLPHVREYFHQKMMDAIGQTAPVALTRMVSLLHADSEHVQLEASKQLLDRSGYGKGSTVMKLQAGELTVNIDLS